jgi:hypothetical protein
MILITGVQAPRVCRGCRAYLVAQNLISPKSLSTQDLEALDSKNFAGVDRAAYMLKTRPRWSGSMCEAQAGGDPGWQILENISSFYLLLSIEIKGEKRC